MRDSDFSALDWQKRQFGDLEERRREGNGDAPFVQIARWAIVVVTILAGAAAGMLVGGILRS